MHCCICVGEGAGTQEELCGLQSVTKNITLFLKKQNITFEVVIIKSYKQKIPSCDFVFNLCDNHEGFPDSFIEFTEYLEKTGIKYTGNTSLCFKACYDKLRWSEYDLIRPYLPQRDALILDKNIGPVIVKHRFFHGSLYEVKQFETNICSQVSDLIQTGNYFYEKFIEGVELTVGVLPDSSYFIGAQKQKQNSFLNFKTKWRTPPKIYKPNLSPKIVFDIEQVIYNVKKTFFINSYMRLDFRINKDKKVFLIDINPNCSLDKEGSFCKAAALYSVSYQDILTKISNNFLGIYF